MLAGGEVDDAFPEAGGDFDEGVGGGVPVVEVADEGDVAGVGEMDADGVGDVGGHGVLQGALLPRTPVISGAREE